MKHTTYLTLLVLLFSVSCSNDKRQQKEDADSLSSSRAEPVKVDSLPWNAVFNPGTQLLELKKSPGDLSNASPEQMANAINRKYSDILLEIEGRKADTLFAKIQEAEKLTQGMGTTGAETYLAEVTYALTELKGVKAVDFDFKAGDHAIPGVYTRQSFKNYH